MYLSRDILIKGAIMSIDSVSSTTTNYYSPTVTSSTQTSAVTETASTSNTDEISLSGTSSVSPETIISSLAPEGISYNFV